MSSDRGPTPGAVSSGAALFSVAAILLKAGMAGDAGSRRLRGELARVRAALRHRLSGFASPLEHERLQAEFTRLRAECVRLGLSWRTLGGADDPGTPVS